MRKRLPAVFSRPLAPCAGPPSAGCAAPTRRDRPSAAAHPQLTGAGVTAAMCDAVQAKIDAANPQLIVPRDTVVAKRAATESLVTAFSTAADMLAEWIDPLLVPLAKSDPEFYARYQAAREIVDRPATRTSASADSGTGQNTAPAAAPAATPAPIKLAA